MTDTIEIELPNSPMNTVTDFTNNLSYTSFSWSKDETKVPDQNQQEAAKDPTATNRWPRALLVLTAVIAVSALGVAVVTEFVLKSECPHNEVTETVQCCIVRVCGSRVRKYYAVFFDDIKYLKKQ
jgi:multisubunit Na+/H+ antiporter MnhC subunit